jgi:pilus assembly protein Flp/PilA
MDMNNFIKMLNDESGASAAEYALILAIVGAGIALASYNLGQSITTAMSTAGACIDGTTDAEDCGD